MYRIDLTSDAIEDISSFPAYERKKIIDGIERNLQYQPTRETRNRKRLRPNQVAEWELRMGKFRVFYDVSKDEGVVKIEAVGYKDGSVLFIHGEEYQL
jgi:mRNA interferase RelE/StbE